MSGQSEPRTGAVPPGGTIGMLGGGQLGRMMILAAARIGLRSHVFCPDAESPAFDVTPNGTVAAYDDEGALARFAEQVDVVTFEFENVPADTAAFLAERTRLRPGAVALATAQDRLREKEFLRDAGIAPAPFAAVANLEDLASAIHAVGLPAILKTRRFGYDGKGQVRIDEQAEAAAAFAEIGHRPAILEAFVPFQCEVSVVLARSADGTNVTYDVAENQHENHILRKSLVPAGIPVSLADHARAIGSRIATALDYVGVLAVEFFVTPDGDGMTLLVNEIAPRVHNSGHWTELACPTSQFEQHIRAVAGWPLGKGGRRFDVCMTNLLGHEADEWQRLAERPDGLLHLYGKRETRNGRKMGHFTEIVHNGLDRSPQS
ncbi:MAG: 5-(carboxyamino)imidazole ribonucleotide synthase [Pseudomonadota bacterium]